MPAGLHDMASMTVSGTPGTGDITLSSAIFQTFAAAGAVDGEPLAIGITDGTDWAVERVTYVASGPSLTGRTLVFSSTGALLNLTSAATVYITALAEDLAPAIYRPPAWNGCAPLP